MTVRLHLLALEYLEVLVALVALLDLEYLEALHHLYPPCLLMALGYLVRQTSPINNSERSHS